MVATTEHEEVLLQSLDRTQPLAYFDVEEVDVDVPSLPQPRPPYDKPPEELWHNLQSYPG